MRLVLILVSSWLMKVWWSASLNSQVMQWILSGPSGKGRKKASKMSISTMKSFIPTRKRHEQWQPNFYTAMTQNWVLSIQKKIKTYSIESLSPPQRDPLQTHIGATVESLSRDKRYLQCYTDFRRWVISLRSWVLYRNSNWGLYAPWKFDDFKSLNLTLLFRVN